MLIIVWQDTTSYRWIIFNKIYRSIGEIVSGDITFIEKRTLRVKYTLTLTNYSIKDFEYGLLSNSRSDYSGMTITILMALF
jgi:hypothetical protein